MKLEIPIAFKDLQLTDKELILVEMLTTLHKRYVGKWRFGINDEDLKIILRDGKNKNTHINGSYLNNRFQGLVEFVQITDETWLVCIKGKRVANGIKYDHELTDIRAIKIYCYLMGRLAAGIAEDEFEVNPRQKQAYLNKKYQSFLNKQKIKELNNE